MTDVFCFLSLSLPWQHLDSLGRPLQRLDPGLLIRAQDMRSGFVQSRRGFVQFTYFGYLSDKLCSVFDLRLQPVFNAMWL